MLRSMKQGKLFAIVAALILAATIIFPLACTQTASALEIEKCSARSNQDSGAGVLGATETRVTWEAQTDDSETISTIWLTFPQGTEFSIEDTRLTKLSGADKMTREFLGANYEKEDDTLKISLNEP